MHKEKYLIIFVIIIILSSWLRLRSLGDSPMGWDQSITLNRSMEWINGGPLPLTSMQSSFGIYNPPFVQYLYAIALIIRRNILDVIRLIALVNLAGIAITGLALARIFNWRVAIITSLLIGVCPWAVFFSRMIWMQSFVPGLSSLLFSCVLLYFYGDSKPQYLILIFISLAGLVQSHVTSVTLILPLIVIAIFHDRKLEAKPLVIGISIFILSFLPYLIFQIRTDFSDLAIIQKSVHGESTTDYQSFRRIISLLQSEAHLDPIKENLHRRDLLKAIDLTDDLIVYLFITSILYATLTLLKNLNKNSIYILLLLWLLMPPLLFIRHPKIPIMHYYFLYIYPVPFVMIALFIDRIYVWSKKKLLWAEECFESQLKLTWLAYLIYLPILLISISQGSGIIAGQNTLIKGQTEDLRAIDVQKAIDNANQVMSKYNHCELVVLGEGPIYETSSFGLLREFTKLSRVRFADTGTKLYPHPCAVYFVSNAHKKEQQWAEEIGTRLPTYTVQSANETWLFYVLLPETRAEIVSQMTPPSPLGTWTNGVTLNSITPKYNTEDNLVTISMVWEVGPNYKAEHLPSQPIAENSYMLTEEGKSSRRIHTGCYLLTPDQEIIGQFDTVGLDSREWKPGDVFEFDALIYIPQDYESNNCEIAVALYLYPEIRNLTLLNEQNLLILDSIKCPIKDG